MNKRISEYILMNDVDDQKVILCAKCRYSYCSAEENYKDNALMNEFSPSKLGALFKKSERFIIREFYCPQCGTMFDVEVRLKGQPFLWDAHLKV